MGEVFSGDDAHEVEDVHESGLGGEELHVRGVFNTEAIIWKE